MPPISLPVLERDYLDNSILSTLGRCPRLAFYNYRLARASRNTSFPINFGNAYHTFRESLERSYMKLVLEDGMLFEDAKTLCYETAVAMALKGWEDPPLEHRKGYLDEGRLMKTFSEAYENWQTEKIQGRYKIIGTETPFCLPLPRVLCHSCFQWSEPQREAGRWVEGNRGGRCPHCDERDLHTEYFAGKLDQITVWNRQVWIRDWKTVGRKDNWSAKYSPDHQFTGYAWAARHLSGRRITGAIIDVVYNIKTKGPEFHPTLANRTSNDIEMWLEWVEWEYALYRRCEATGVWPMRTTACGDWGGCFFRDACNTGSWTSIERWLEQRTIASVWDPLHPEEEKGLPE